MERGHVYGVCVGGGHVYRGPYVRGALWGRVPVHAAGLPRAVAAGPAAPPGTVPGSGRRHRPLSHPHTALCGAPAARTRPAQPSPPATPGPAAQSRAAHLSPRPGRRFRSARRAAQGGAGSAEHGAARRGAGPGGVAEVSAAGCGAELGGHVGGGRVCRGRAGAATRSSGSGRAGRGPTPVLEEAAPGAGVRV